MKIKTIAGLFAFLCCALLLLGSSGGYKEPPYHRWGHSALYYEGNGGGLTNVPANSLTGTVATASMPTNYFASISFDDSGPNFTPNSTPAVLTNSVTQIGLGFNHHATQFRTTNTVSKYYATSWGVSFYTGSIDVYTLQLFSNNVAVPGTSVAAFSTAPGDPVALQGCRNLYFPSGTAVDMRLQGPATECLMISGNLNVGTP